MYLPIPHLSSILENRAFFFLTIRVSQYKLDNFRVRHIGRYNIRK